MEKLPPRVTLRLIGTPSLEDGGQPIRLARRKSLGLLAYLALEKGPHGRDSLAALFWPECDQKRARGNLRSSIFELGNIFGEEGLHTRQDRVELDGSSIKVDVLEMEELARPCPEHGPDRTCLVCSNRFEAAARSWGSPRAGFMDGFTLQGSCDFDDWQFSWRDRLHEELRTLLRRLALADRLSGDMAGAGAWAERWLEASPLDGEARRLEVCILIEAGKRDKARERYEVWAETSRRELGQPLGESFEKLAGAERSQAGGEGKAPGLQGQPSGELVGRDGELNFLGSLLEGHKGRLVTIRGTGGLGKTALARAVLEREDAAYPGGAFFIDLSSLHDPSLLPIAIAEGIGMTFDGKARTDIAERLRVRLGTRPSLLVLDNFEQLLEARGFVERLIGSCPRLVVLATSREALGLGIETVFDPPPLLAPPAGARILPGEIGSWPALDLITRRALAANPDFELSERNLEDCSTLCARLDGLPLALELAASRFEALEPGELVERLDRKLDLLAAREARGPDRHRTLRAVIDWSHELLSQREQELFALLGLFPESFDLDAVEAILGTEGAGEGSPSLLDSMSALISKSLLRRRCDAGRTRYFFPEALREYARARLEGDPRRTELEMRLALHYLELAREKSPGRPGHGQKEAFRLLGLERHNFRVALSQFLYGHGVREALELCSCLSWFWYRTGQYDWGRWALEKTLELERAEGSLPGLRARCLRALGWFRFVQGSWREAEEYYLSALPLLEKEGDNGELALCLSDLGVTQRWLGKHEAGDEACTRAVATARGAGEPAAVARALVWCYATTGGRQVDAGQEAGLEEAARLARSLGDDWTEAHAFEGLGDYLREAGRYGEARACFEEAARGFTAADDEWLLAWAFEGKGMNSLLSGDPGEAAGILGETAARFAGLGDPGSCAYALGELSLALRALGKEGDADRLLGAACAIVAGSEGAAREGGAKAGCCGEELSTRAKGLAWSGDGRLGEAVAGAAARDSEAWREGRRLSLETALRLAAEAASG
jgi:predicted ATPase/DNA-binding SARP family transcriptional activator